MMYMKSVFGCFHAESVGQDLVCEDLLERTCGSCLAIYPEAQVLDLAVLLEPGFCNFGRNMEHDSSRMLP